MSPAAPGRRVPPDHFGSGRRTVQSFFEQIFFGCEKKGPFFYGGNSRHSLSFVALFSCFVVFVAIFFVFKRHPILGEPAFMLG